jgi:uncharacterized protein with PQ loop repeat
MTTNTLGIIAMAVSFWGVLEQIWKVERTKSAGDLSRLTVLLWVVSLGIFFYIAWKTTADSIFLWNYGINFVFYVYLFKLVHKYQTEYKMPFSKKHLTVFKGGKEPKNNAQGGNK